MELCLFLSKHSLSKLSDLIKKAMHECLIGNILPNEQGKDWPKLSLLVLMASLAEGSWREELEKLEHLAMEDQEVSIWLSDKTIFWL